MGTNLNISSCKEILVSPLFVAAPLGSQSPRGGVHTLERGPSPVPSPREKHLVVITTLLGTSLVVSYEEGKAPQATIDRENDKRVESERDLE